MSSTGEHPPGRTIRILPHNLIHQPAERADARRRLDTAEQAGPVHIPSGQVGQGAATAVLMLHAAWSSRPGGCARVPAGESLQLGLLIGRNHVLVRSKHGILPYAPVQIEDSGRLGIEIRIARKDPTAVVPGPYGIGRKPAPDGGPGDIGHHPLLDGGLADIVHRQTGKGNPQGGGKLTG